MGPAREEESMEIIDLGAGFRITPVAADGYVEWRVSGELNMFRAPRLADAVRRAMAGGIRCHLIDLTTVETVDASGVQALVRLHKGCGPAGRLVVAARPGAQPWKMLAVTGACRILEVSDDPDAAVQDLRRAAPLRPRQGSA
jgi:anti-sigma B factor antagonist